VDHSSGHGTLLDGRRVPPCTPVRVRRGALLTFGGQSAPSFIYKAFCRADRMLRDVADLTSALQRRAESLFIGEQDSNSSGGVSCIRGDGGALACVSEDGGSGEAALTLLNTRINACGGYVDDLLEGEWSEVGLAKRSRDSFSIISKASVGECTDYLIPLKKRKVTGHFACSGVSSRSPVLAFDGSAIQTTKRNVRFVDAAPSKFYPVSVTPDEFASDEEDAMNK